MKCIYVVDIHKSIKQIIAVSVETDTILRFHRMTTSQYFIRIKLFMMQFWFQFQVPIYVSLYKFHSPEFPVSDISLGVYSNCLYVFSCH